MVFLTKLQRYRYVYTIVFIRLINSTTMSTNFSSKEKTDARSLVWDLIGERYYETGVDHGVLVHSRRNSGVYDKGVAWNGLVSVTESPTGAEATAQYADNIKYLNLISVEEFGATIEAFTYPEEWAQFDGLAIPDPGVFVGQQPRKMFGLSYRTRVGNDVEGDAYAYKLHLVYGCKAAPSEKAYNTINDSPEAITFSWEISTTPVPVTGYSVLLLFLLLILELWMLTNLTALEVNLYGAAATAPKLPTPDEVIAMITTP